MHISCQRSGSTLSALKQAVSQPTRLKAIKGAIAFFTSLGIFADSGPGGEVDQVFKIKHLYQWAGIVSSR
jgi:hypothetical protein